MLNKEQIRRKFFVIRKKKYFEVSNIFFYPLLKFLKRVFKNKKIFLSIYYPSNYEVNTLKLVNLINKNKNITTLLPKISLERNLSFHKWSKLDQLHVNKYGMLEPISNKKKIVPNVVLLPLLAFDGKNNRIGYGKGYYDKFLNKCFKKKIKIMTIGVAFSFQKYKKLPLSKFDVKLNYILTEKGMSK